MTPADILLTGAFGAVALVAAYFLVMWLAEGVIDALEFLSHYE